MSLSFQFFDLDYCFSYGHGIFAVSAQSDSSGLSFWPDHQDGNSLMRQQHVRYALTFGSCAMTAADFRRIALSLEGVEEYSHAGLPAFRVGSRKFASLASQAEGYGNLMLTPEQQAAFVEEAPEVFLPIPGG